MEVALLAALMHRRAHERWAQFIKPQAVTKDAWTILTSLGEWWEQQPPEVKELDVDAFKAWYALVRHAKMDKDRLTVHRALIDQMGQWEGEGEQTSLILNNLIKRDYASRIAEQALRIADGDYSLPLESVEQMVEDYRREANLTDSDAEKVGEFSLDALSSVSGPGLNWRLQNLMRTAGPIRKGDLIVFGKRPDAGGTTFLASEATFMGEQMENPEDVILWLNNEEAGNKVRRRIVQAALGWTNEELEEDLPGALRAYAELMGGNPNRIVVYDDSKLTFRTAERVMRELRPKLIIADQLWKFTGGPSLEGVEASTYAFNWAREQAKEYAPFIAVHQIGVEGDDKRYNSYGTLYGNKTGLQGEADLIIMMGRTMRDGNSRFFWAPKNKLLTPGDPTARNAQWEAIIDTERARFEEY